MKVTIFFESKTVSIHIYLLVKMPEFLFSVRNFLLKISKCAFELMKGMINVLKRSQNHKNITL